jgi:hypothetical protein
MRIAICRKYANRRGDTVNPTLRPRGYIPPSIITFLQYDVQCHSLKVVRIHPELE